MPVSHADPFASRTSCWAVFLIFLRLGLTSFGGPIAHLGYFREEFVTRRHWLDERSYADLVALCQFLPGPASSQVGLAIGLFRAGLPGALAAWAGFTLPSALMLTLLALGLSSGAGTALPPGILHGLKLVAVAVVAQAVWGMARSLCPDRLRMTLAVATACAVLWWPGGESQWGAMLLSGILGVRAIKPTSLGNQSQLPVSIGTGAGGMLLFVFFALLGGLPLLTTLWPIETLQQLDAFYRAGALVFGGGHVVLPLLEAEVVQTGWVDTDRFLAGYGAAQAVPGPLFTFAAFLGAMAGGWSGAVLCLLAIFLPAFLLVVGALPFWARLRGSPHAQAALAGVNAAVVGLLLAALYDPIWSRTVKHPDDFALVLIAFTALLFWKLPPWLVVAAGALLGWLSTLW